MTRSAVVREFVYLAVFTALAVMAVGMAVKIGVVVATAPDSFAPHLRQKFISNYSVVVTHGLSGCFALALGIVQFIRPLRTRMPRLHRTIGSLYLLCVAISGTTGLRMALIAHGGPVAVAGFLLLAILWLSTGGAALLSILRGNSRAHGRWMVRNYALTFSAVMVRVWLTVFERLEVPHDFSYILVAWISWVLPLLCAEVILRLLCSTYIKFPEQ